LQVDEYVVLTMPSMCGAPISEHSGHQTAIVTLPPPFHTGGADFVAGHDDSVEMNEWALFIL
jgi:hypothetical protein